MGICEADTAPADFEKGLLGGIRALLTMMQVPKLQRTRMALCSKAFIFATNRKHLIYTCIIMAIKAYEKVDGEGSEE